MADKLFDRVAEVVVGTRLFADLKVDFSFVKTLKPQPNKGEIKIYNLSRDSIRYIEQLEVAPVEVRAGYRDAVSTIFLGHLRSPFTYRDGPNVVTMLSCGDGEAQLRSSRVAKSFAPGVTPDKILKEIAASLGVAKGNINEAVIKIRVNGLGKSFSQGVCLYGSGPREMTRICESFGLTWSVQSGKLQILERGKALDGTAIELSADSGMWGSPSVDTKGKLTLSCAMIRDIFPGRKIVVKGEYHQGQYIVQQTTHVGTTVTTEESSRFGIDLEGQRY